MRRDECQAHRESQQRPVLENLVGHSQPVADDFGKAETDEVVHKTAEAISEVLG